ncbi:MAG: hypothetical protein AAFQ41_14325 [Cyanobacteria bacterium J06623_7]
MAKISFPIIERGITSKPDYPPLAKVSMSITDKAMPGLSNKSKVNNS